MAMMSEKQAKWARENYDLHCALREVAKISPRINRAGRLYKKKLDVIRHKYQVEI